MLGMLKKGIMFTGDAQTVSNDSVRFGEPVH